MNLSSAAESVVVALAKTGDRDAFGELVSRRQSWLRNLFRRLCRDKELADDLAQQTFLQAWRSLRELRSTAAFGGWLKTLAVNVWLQHLRRRDPLSLQQADIDVAELLAQKERPDAAIDLDDALAQLPPQVRLCIVLSCNEGMSHGMIAEVSGMPLGTVKSHLLRGTGKLRELLSAYAPATHTPASISQPQDRMKTEGERK